MHLEPFVQGIENTKHLPMYGTEKSPERLINTKMKLFHVKGTTFVDFPPGVDYILMLASFISPTWPHTRATTFPNTLGEE
jgi:hypothetical protein